MKKSKFLLTATLCFSFIFNLLNINVNAFEISLERNEISYKNTASEYVSNAFDKIVESLMESDLFVSRVNDINALGIGTSFFVYDSSDTVQENVFYFPIIDESQNNVVYLIEAIGVDNGYICNPLDHMVDVLNEIDYIDNQSIAYLYNYDVYFETQTDKINTTYYYNDDYNMEMNPYISSFDNSFVNRDFNEKRSQILDSMKSLSDFHEYNWKSNDEILNTKLYGYLTLSNPQGQYGYGMCWASSVATVHNYLKPLSSVVTGFEVCNRMGIGYGYGGSVYDEQDALWLYGINYNYIRNINTFNWSYLTSNIDSLKPLIANGYSAIGAGHAVTVTGYTGSSSTNNNVRMWNGNLNGGSGGYEYISYGNGYFTDGSGTIFYWQTTLSYQ